MIVVNYKNVQIWRRYVEEKISCIFFNKEVNLFVVVCNNVVEFFEDLVLFVCLVSIINGLFLFLFGLLYKI